MNGTTCHLQSVPPPTDLFQQMVIKPDHPIVLQVNGDRAQFKTTLLGIDYNDFIIVKIPAQLDVKNKLVEGASITVRLEHSGTLFGFKVSLISFMLHPSRVMFLKYPSDVEHIRLRQNMRVKCLIPALIEYDGASRHGYVYDISKGGCRLVLPKNNDNKTNTDSSGSQITIFIHIDGLHLERFIGQVRSVTGHATATTLGVSFNNDQETHALAVSFVDNLKNVELLCNRVDVLNVDGIAAMRRSCGHDRSTVCLMDSKDAMIKPGKSIEFQFIGDHLFGNTSVLCIDSQDTVISGYNLSSKSKVFPRVGTGIKIFFEDHGSIYSFISHVTKFITKPKPLLFFSFPKKIEAFQMRSHRRIRCIVPSIVENSHFQGQCYIRDISEGGCCVVTDIQENELVRDITDGDQLEVYLPLDGVSFDKFKTQVKRVHIQNNTITIGLAFSYDKENLQLIKAMMDKLLAVDMVLANS